MELKKEWHSAINFRTSRRAYIDKELGEFEVNRITSLINEVNKEGNLKIQFIKDGSKLMNGFKASYGMISGAKSFIALVGNKNIKNLKNRVGYYGEFIVLECTNLGVGSCWLGGTYDKEECKKHISLSKDDELVCIICLGYVNKDKSLKEKLISKLSMNTMDKNKFLISQDQVPDWVNSGVDSAIKAPSALNKKPVSYSFINGKLKAFITKGNHGFEAVDLGIAMSHFQLGALSNGVYGKWEVENQEYVFKIKSTS